LTPVELQEARRRSGRLGGRPRKPTREDARAAALETLVRPAGTSLRAHLADGDAARCEFFELAYGPAPVQPPEDVSLPETAADVQGLSWRELQVVAARVFGELPASAEHAATITNVVPSIIGKRHGHVQVDATPLRTGIWRRGTRLRDWKERFDVAA
jgi:hypothetical protein